MTPSNTFSSSSCFFFFLLPIPRLLCFPHTRNRPWDSPYECPSAKLENLGYGQTSDSCTWILTEPEEDSKNNFKSSHTYGLSVRAWYNAGVPAVVFSNQTVNTSRIGIILLIRYVFLLLRKIRCVSFRIRICMGLATLEAFF